MAKEAVVPAGLIPCETRATGSEGVGPALWEAEPGVSPLRERLEKNMGLCSLRAAEAERTDRSHGPRGGLS